jgi:hypothetical protein
MAQTHKEGIPGSGAPSFFWATLFLFFCSKKGNQKMLPSCSFFSAAKKATKKCCLLVPFFLQQKKGTKKCRRYTKKAKNR